MPRVSAALGAGPQPVRPRAPGSALLRSAGTGAPDRATVLLPRAEVRAAHLRRAGAGRDPAPPAAVQVLDRWHLLRNVREVAERVLERHLDQLRAVGEVPPDQAVPSPPRRSRREEARREGVRQRAEERHAAIQRLAAEGLSLRAIARRLKLARGTVRRYRYAAAAPERAAYARRPSMLDPYTAYLERRWAEGCRNGLQLWRELRERGYPGSRRLVAVWARTRRTEPTPTTPHRHFTPPGATPAAAPPSSSCRWSAGRARRHSRPG